MTPEERIQEHLSFLYGEPESTRVWDKLRVRLAEFREHNPDLVESAWPPSERLTERDVILITYSDQISEPDRPPLQTLREFLDSHLRDIVSGVHLLPFFPYSSDDGFSVVDYRQVNPKLGDWDDVSRIGQNFDLMFDAVVNHISRQSKWFEAFRRGEEPYVDYFITMDPEEDLSMVVRPRDLPLLTPVETSTGPRQVWTTFSEDQIDLNYACPGLLLDVIDVLLFYVEKGAQFIRLDAIAYLWKQAGTPSIHLTQTHRVVKLFRAVLDAVAPNVLLITETNVSHEENISYFGSHLPDLDRTDEAQMVYQFPLAPLVLHTFLTGDSGCLSKWASHLAVPQNACFLNFIASHDGIGVMPARGLLSEGEIDALVDNTVAHGGRVSYKTNADGSESVYELNISLFDALSDPRTPHSDVDVRRFLAAQAILLSLAGVPGIYVHSLLGSRNCRDCVEESGRARSINREKFRRDELERQLADGTSLRHRVFDGYRNLLRLRQTQPAFDPNGQQHVLSLHDAVFALLRIAPDDSHDMILCLINVSDKSQEVLFGPTPAVFVLANSWQDLFTSQIYVLDEDPQEIALEGYQVLWLKPVR